MAISHFTVETCPNCGAESKAVGDPTIDKWFCFNCHATGSWEYTVEFAPPQTDEPPVEAA